MHCGWFASPITYVASQTRKQCRQMDVCGITRQIWQSSGEPAPSRRCGVGWSGHSAGDCWFEHHHGRGFTCSLSSRVVNCFLRRCGACVVTSSRRRAFSVSNKGAIGLVGPSCLLRTALNICRSCSSQGVPCHNEWPPQAAQCLCLIVCLIKRPAWPPLGSSCLFQTASNLLG